MDASSCGDMVSVLDMGCFQKLINFEVENDCFSSITELKMSGLPMLKKFTCGDDSFVQCSRFVFESDAVFS